MRYCQTFLTTVILSRLPNQIHVEWARKCAGHKRDLTQLLTFLWQEIEGIERSKALKNVTTGKRESLTSPEEQKNWQTQEPKGKVSFAAVLLTSWGEEKTIYGFCDKKHGAKTCFYTQRLCGQECVGRIMTTRMCSKCLGEGYIARGCYVKYQICRG